MRIAKLFCYVLWIVLLCACNNSQSNSNQQIVGNSQDSILRAQYNALLAVQSENEERLERALQLKNEEITRLTNNREQFITENMELRKVIQQKNQLLDSKNNEDRRALYLWGGTNWFWVHQCSQWNLVNLGFPLCQFTQEQQEAADRMVGQGYPIDPTNILLTIPFVIAYLGIVTCLLLWVIAMGLAWAVKRPCKEILFEVSPRYRQLVNQKYEDQLKAHEEEVLRMQLTLGDAHSQLGRVQSKIAQGSSALDQQDQQIAEKLQIIEDYGTQAEEAKAEYYKIVRNCVDFFIREANDRETYLQLLESHLMDPTSEDFEKYTGMTPTERAQEKAAERSIQLIYDLWRA